MNHDEAVAAVNAGTAVRLKYAHGDEWHARGRVVAYCDAPMVWVLTPDGESVWWRADLTEVDR